MEIQKKRDSNLELLRIVAMFFIIAHHYVVNSGLMDPGGPMYGDLLSPRALFLLSLAGIGKSAMNIYVLITGYFMCVSNIIAKKYFKLLFEWMFYRLLIGSIFWLTGREPFTFLNFINVIIPIRQVAYNFTECYLLFYLFIPFLNRFIRGLNEKQYLYLIGLCLLTYVFFGTLHDISFNYISWFFILYLIAAYIRLFPKPITQNSSFCGKILTFSLILSWLSMFLCAILTVNNILWTPFYFVQDANSLLPLVNGLSAFLYFKNKNIPYNRTLNRFAASSFGVLLIHANSKIMHKWLWVDSFKVYDAYNSSFVYLHAVGSILLVFILCALIDMLRIQYIEKPFFALWDAKWAMFRKKYDKAEEKLLSRFIMPQ